MQVERDERRAPGVIGSRRDGKRVYSTEHKRLVVQQCMAPGASVSGVALSHGVNANLVRKWIANYQRWANRPKEPTPALLPVALEESAVFSEGGDVVRSSSERNETTPGSIEIELSGGRVRITGAVDIESLRSVIELLSQRR